MEYPEMIYCIGLKFLKFLYLYTFFRFDHGIKILCTCRIKACGQDIGLKVKISVNTDIFKSSGWIIKSIF